MIDATIEFRKLPKIDELLSDARLDSLVTDYGREQIVAAVRAEVELARTRISKGGACPEPALVVAATVERLVRESRPTLRRVINASGVIIHTNLGRAPLSDEAIAAMAEVARGYSNLEFDLEEGERGSRHAHCGALLARLTGAEDGVVVNNNASSVILLLAALARSREVIVSRGQLVEIGGGFRIPDVMRESGATLVEVGTTNRTYARDYEAAITTQTAAFMLVHRSNFQVVGFTHDATLEELAQVARKKGVYVLDDLGSGTLLETKGFGLAHEPTVQERIAAGADLVCFSGDKLLGGPQAGCIVGRRSLIERLKSAPLMRALRVDKVTLAGVEATLRHYLRGEAHARIPVWRSISAELATLEARALQWKAALGAAGSVASIVESTSTVGGGSLPGTTLPTRALGLSVPAVDQLAARLRRGSTPVVGRIEDDRFLLDPRTVMPHEDDALVAALRAALA